MSPLASFGPARAAPAGGAATGTTARAARRRGTTAWRREARHTAHTAYAIVLLVALRLHCGGSEQRDLLALLDSAHDFGVVEVADAQPHDARLVRPVLGDEDEARTRAPRRKFASLHGSGYAASALRHETAIALAALACLTTSSDLSAAAR